MSSSSDEEDDLPPPLEDVSQELSKLGVKDASYEAKSKKKDAPAAVKKKGLRKGFFDAPRRTAKKTSTSSKKRDDEDMVELKAKQSRNGGGGGSHSQQNKVPDWMKIDPDSDASRMMQMKEKVVDAMKPTPDMMQNVMGNQDLMSGFDSPEVMMAVNDIAKNPENIKKYKDNPKVMAFYQNMAKTMATRFEKLAEEEEAEKKNSKREEEKTQQRAQQQQQQAQSFQDKLNFNLKAEERANATEEKDFKPLIEEL